MKARYKKGQTVWEDNKEVVIKGVHLHRLLPIYQYTFEAPNDGYAVGEQSLRDSKYSKKLTLSECMGDTNIQSTIFNTISSAKRHPIMFDRTEQGDISEIMGSEGDTFFRPDIKLIKWLIKYAGDRLIIDVGSGQGHLVNQIKRFKGKAIGIEPNFDYYNWLKFRKLDDGIPDINEILPYTIQQKAKFIQGMPSDKVLIVFARPCHTRFVEEGIDILPVGMESLYITLPENLNLYDDLGGYKQRARKIEHEGISEDNEVIYSIIK